MSAWLFLFSLLIAGFAAVVLWRGLGRSSSAEPVRRWRIVLPREAAFPPENAAALFRALAPLLPAHPPHPSVEFVSSGRELELRLSAPATWEGPVRGQLAAWFPGARLEPIAPEPPRQIVALPLTLEQPAVLPIRLAAAGEPDPLLGLFGALVHSEGTAGVRLTWKPASFEWRHWAPVALAALQAGARPPARGVRFWLRYGLSLLVPRSDPTTQPPLASGVLANAAAKLRDPCFGAQLVLWTPAGSGGDVLTSSGRLTALAAHLHSGFRDPLGNSLVTAGKPQLLTANAPSGVPQDWIELSAAELAALFHVPSPDHPLVPAEAGRRSAPPAAMIDPPAEVPGNADRQVTLGEALAGEKAVPFGLAAADRRQHTYVVGKTGTGKSTLLATVLRQDLVAGRGVGLIDPHGDLAERVLAFISRERWDQVLYFHPADRDFPVAFNPLALTAPEQRPLVASGVISVFKKLYGESWGPRLEYFLRNAVLALLETPAPSLLALPRLLVDRGFRAGVLQHVRDPLLRSFFLTEYEQYDPRWRAEAISPILNKVGQFLSSPVVRHVVGQSRPGFSIRELMNEGQIFIANLASGKIGEDNAALLGGLLVSGFQLAAMSRADQPEENRRDFHLAVDEFQHFATEAFGTILSEARKYRLSLTLSHQYLDQLPSEISEAVFGNVGSLCVFRVGAGDTVRLAKELAPVFDGQDLVHLPNHHFCARIARAGQIIPPFSARTIPVSEVETDLTPLIEESRARWARPRAEVELEIEDLWEGRVDATEG